MVNCFFENETHRALHITYLAPSLPYTIYKVPNRDGETIHIELLERPLSKIILTCF